MAREQGVVGVMRGGAGRAARGGRTVGGEQGRETRNS